MTTYASVADVKAYLKINDSSQDALLGSLLGQAEAVINKYLGVDTILNSTQTERFPIQFRFPDFFFSKSPVTEISKINWKTYVGTLWVDFIIKNGRNVEFIYINSYIVDCLFDTFEIEYKAWLASVPEDVKLAEMMLVSWMYGSTGVGANTYDSYAIGDERVTYAKKTESNIPDEVKSILNQYKLFS